MKTTTKFKKIFIVSLLVLVGNFNADAQCFGYSSCNGFKNPYSCFSCGNCVWYARNQVDCRWGIDINMRGNANTWAPQAISQGYTVSSVPIVNSIACSKVKAGGNGHVAVVEEILPGDMIKVSEMNWQSDTGCTKYGAGVRTHNYPISWFDQGYIYPPIITHELNQDLPIYGGTVANPKEINLVFPYSGSFQISQISNIKISGGSVTKSINTLAIKSSESFFVDNPGGKSSKIWQKVTILPIASELSGLPNGRGYTISFDLNNGGVKKFQNGRLYFEDYHGSNVFTDLSDTDWSAPYIKLGAEMGLYRGPDVSHFNPSVNLTKEQAAIVLVNLGVRLRLININTETTYGVFEDVSTSHPNFRYIQTLRNYGYVVADASFNPTEPITVGQFCKMLTKVINIQTTDYAPYALTNGLNRRIVAQSSTQDLQDAMNKLLNIIDVTDKNGFWVTNNSWDFFDFSTISAVQKIYGVNGSAYVSRAKMARVILNMANWKAKKTGNSLYKTSAIKIEPALNDMVALGEQYDNADITATSTPVTPSQQTYSCASGGSVTILYNPGSLPQHYYWSMLKNGATLTSNNEEHSSVTFTAPTVSTSTQWKLYTYTANNKGKARETFITINVEPTSVSIVVPSKIEINSYRSDGIEIVWDGVGNGISNYQAQYCQDPNFNNDVIVRNETSSNATMTWPIQGLQNGTYYARVKAINSSGISSNWSNVVSYSLNANTQPFISTVTPLAGTTISGNSATLNFQATGGNGPLTYTVYFSNWNPQGNPPAAANISTTSFTVNNLTPNNTYYWAVKVVDADGDEFITGNYAISTQAATTKPTGTIVIENGAVNTNSISVNLNITATAFSNGNIVGMRFSNDGLTWPENWEQYNVNRPAWSLVGFGGTSTPGNKTIYAQFRDNSGNISQSYSDNITLLEGVKGVFIVRDRTFESLRAANDYAVSGDTIYATAGYFDLTSEKGSSPYLSYSSSVGGGIKNGVSLIGEGAEKTTLFWDGIQTKGLGLSSNNIIQGITLIVSPNPNVSRATLMLHGASNIIVKNCIIKNGNIAIEGFNYDNSGTPSNITIQNNLIINNNSKAINIQTCNGLNILNNTINNNDFACLQIGDCSNINFKNNIVTNNKSDAITIYNYTNLDFKNNNVFNNRFSATSAIENYVNFAGHLSDQSGLNGNISVDPLFVNSTSYNFNLNAISPSVNTGLIVGLPYFGLAPDMGAYELGGSGSIVLNSNVTTTFLVTKPDETKQTVSNGQTISNLPQGFYGIYPQSKVGYFTPGNSFVYLSINEAKSYTANYILDSQGPEGKIYLNGNVYSTQSPYVTIFCDVVDKVNGLQNGQMQFSNDGSTWSTPEPIKNKKLLWDLSNGTPSNLTPGTKSVYAKFSDKNGFWSSAITNSIEYIPTAKIKILEPNNNVSNLDFRNNILNSQPGDILILKEGTHTIFGGSITLPIGLTLQGIAKQNSIVRNVSSININNGYKFDNIKFYAPSTQNFNSSFSGNSLKSIFTNCISDHQSIQFNNKFNTVVANNIFKDASQDAGLFRVYSDNANNTITFSNNVFDASVNTTSLNAESGINFSGICCGNNFNITNNIFLGFNLGTETGVYMGGSILYTNASNTTGDLIISNNNFYDCAYNIKKYNGLDVSKDNFSYSYNPNLNTDYSLPGNSQLLNSGNTNLLFNDHNGSTNDIGITGGIYYNTAPTVIVTSEETGYNQFKFVANAKDGQTPVGMLQYRWDFNNDGVMDTPFLLTNEVTRTVNTTTDMVVCYVFDELFAIGYHIIPTPTASNISLAISQPQPLAICAGSSSPFQINAIGNFNQGNEFKVIYSKANGDFSNPQFTQNLTAQPNGILNISFPANLATCTTCYLKLVSTNPVNSSNVALAAVYQAPQASVTIAPATTTTICPKINVTFTATPINGGTKPTYTWKKNGSIVGTNSATYASTSYMDGDIIWVEMVSNQTCSTTTPVISAPTTISVTQIDAPFIQAIDNIMAASTDEGVQWMKSGQPIAGATSQFYEATQTGFYQFSVTTNGCTQQSDIYQLTSLSTETNNFESNSLKVYPNPFNELLNIEVNEDNLQAFQIIDLQGRLITQEKISGNSHQINLNRLPQSVYILEVVTDKGKQRVKIVKK